MMSVEFKTGVTNCIQNDDEDQRLMRYTTHFDGRLN